MNELLAKYSTQINDIALYAKRIGFNFSTGNFDEMLNGWIKDGQKFQEFVADNKSEFMNVTKQFI